jgi:uncharacterized damage-inducible protein DinB
MMISRPYPEEYAPFYAGYIQRVPEGDDLFTLLASQPDELRQLLSQISDSDASTRPAPSEWSIKEVIGHICDTERIFAYRALRIGRGDVSPLHGFDQNNYVETGNFNRRSLSDLMEEFSLQRRANILCFQPFTEVEIARRGTASGSPVTVRALLYMMAGHVMHHLESLKTDYQVEAPR